MSTPQVFLLSRDLIFHSRVSEVATACGRVVRTVRSEQGVAELAAAEGVVVLLLDLEKPPAPIAAIAAVVRPLLERGAARCIPFFSHVHTERAAECEQVGLGAPIPRSRFIKVLPELFGS